MRHASLQEPGAAAIVGALTVSFAALLAASSVVADDGETVRNADSPSKLDLTPESLAELLAVGRPSDSEWRHLRVEWLTDVVAARRQAAKEDKPIVICYTGGAGYNEPLGVC